MAEVIVAAFWCRLFCVMFIVSFGCSMNLDSPTADMMYYNPSSSLQNTDGQKLSLLLPPLPQSQLDAFATSSCSYQPQLSIDSFQARIQLLVKQAVAHHSPAHSTLANNVVQVQSTEDLELLQIMVDVMKSYKEMTADAINRLRAEKIRRYIDNIADLNSTQTRHSADKQYLNEYRHLQNDSMLSTWTLFRRQINSHELYSDKNENIDNTQQQQQQKLVVDELLAEMSRHSIVDLETLPEHGTQLKLLAHLDNGMKVLFKPKRSTEHVEISDDTYYFYYIEQHIAEIAAFHVGRVLGFRHVPPTVGVKVDMVEELYSLADNKLKETFFMSPAGNLGFYGSCRYYCEPAHAACGSNTSIEGSLSTFLPAGDGGWKELINPWVRTYNRKDRIATWQDHGMSDSYCDWVRQSIPPFDNQRVLLNLIDVHIFDFIIGNMDRHSVNTFNEFGNDSYFILFDNGKGFVRSDDDELSILAPLYQCCMVRLSTVETLLTLYTSQPTNRLSQRVNRSMQTDPLSPLLTDRQLNALDRRVGLVLQQIETCIEKNNLLEQVILNM